MPELNRLASSLAPSSPIANQVRKSQVTGPLNQAPVQNAPRVQASEKPQQSVQIQAKPPSENLLEPSLLEGPIDQASTQKIQRTANLLPRPSFFAAIENPYAKLGDNELIDQLMKGFDKKGEPTFKTVLRTDKELYASGVLRGFRELAARTIDVPASEFNRSISDDAVLVMRGFAKLDPTQIHEMKEKAYQHPEVAPELKGAIEKNYYGSPQHKEFGALVEQLSGGVLSAEEAMAMCPCGGIPGAGEKEVPLISGIGAVQRHAMRHDALGFLFTRFGVGPGYGSKTTPFGLSNDNPLAGQILGIAREIFHQSSVFSSGEKAATSDRFKA